MPLELLKIHNGRNLKEFNFSPHPRLNIISGANGVGKTTILESIYILLRARTFRTNKFKSFIHYQQNNCTIFSRFSSLKNEIFTLGISRSKDISQPIIHLNAQKIHSLSSITNLVVLAIITPESFSLLDSGPAIRRKFIDWGVFHVEHSFLINWQNYKKILKNRNTLLSKFSSEFRNSHKLSSQQRKLINCWSSQLIVLNNKLDNLRDKQLIRISPYFKEYLDLFSKQLANEINLSFYRGWSKDINYTEYLQKKINEDIIAGYTRYGTHRSELKITINNMMAKDVLSRGQKKIVIICLILAQFRYLMESDSTRLHNLLLLDDMDSELDSSNLQILFKILASLKCQVISTTTDEKRYNFIDKEKYKVFHVKHDENVNKL